MEGRSRNIYRTGETCLGGASRRPSCIAAVCLILLSAQRAFAHPGHGDDTESAPKPVLRAEVAAGLGLRAIGGALQGRPGMPGPQTRSAPVTDEGRDGWHRHADGVVHNHSHSAAAEECDGGGHEHPWTPAGAKDAGSQVPGADRPPAPAALQPSGILLRLPRIGAGGIEPDFGFTFESERRAAAPRGPPLLSSSR